MIVSDAMQREYEALPESIKMIYSRKEWVWLTDAQRANAVQNATERETYEDE